MKREETLPPRTWISLGANAYQGTQVQRTGTAASHNPSRDRRCHLLVSAMVNTGTNASAQAFPCVKIAMAPTVPYARLSRTHPVFANRAKQSVLTSIPKVVRCSVITRALDSCTNGDPRNRTAAKI